MAEYILNILSQYWFWAAAGFIIASILIAVPNCIKNGCSFPVAVIAVTVGIYFGMIGTRALWIFIYQPRLFIEDLSFVLAFWRDTGTWLGSWFGIVGVFIVLKVAGKPFWSNMGSIAPGLAMAHGIARIGCLVQGCCWGTATNVPWAIYSDRLGTNIHPTQAYSTIAEIFSFVILQFMWSKRSGSRKYLYPLYIMMLTCGRFVIGFFRGDDAGPEIIAGLRVYQSIAIFLFIAAACVILILKYKWVGVTLATVVVLAVSILTVAFKPVSDPQLISRRHGSHLYLVVTRDEFAGKLEEWKQLRSGEGYDVVIGSWSKTPSAVRIKKWIKANCADSLCSYILIVGDCHANDASLEKWHIPSVKRQFAKNGRMIEFAADSLYGDIDGGGCPQVPVGRLAVRNVEQLEVCIDKIVRHEKRTISPDWFRTVIWAGAEGYTAQMQNITEAFIELMPKWMGRFVISTDVNSVYSGVITDQPEVFLEQMAEPAILSIIASHGSYRSVTPAVYNGKEIFLCSEDIAKVKSSEPSGILFILGCNSGRFNLIEEKGISLAESFSACPAGPVATVASSDTTGVLTNYLLTRAITEQFDRVSGSTGDFLLGLQRQVYKKGKKTLFEILQGDQLASQLYAVSPQAEKEDMQIPGLIQNEVLMYNLLGDPACSFTVPAEMAMSIRTSEKGEMRVCGQTERACSKLYAEMISQPGPAEKIPAGASDDKRRSLFVQANQRPVKLIEQQIEDNMWSATLFVPREYFSNTDYLRFTAVGKDGVFMSLEGVSGDKPFADRPKEFNTEE